jgi:hypothetical protein
MHDVSPAPSSSVDVDTRSSVQDLLDQYPPVSPTSAATVMAQYQDIDETIGGVAYRLVNTVHKQELAHEIAKMEVLGHIKDRDEEIAQLQVQLAQLHGATLPYERPEGFQDNNGRIPNLIPIRGGVSVAAKWIKQRSDTKIELLAGREAGEERYVVELHAQPNYSIDSPAEPIPVWLFKLLRGPGDAFHSLLEAIEATNDWPLEAEIHQYREILTSCNEFAAMRNAICAELDLEEQRLEACTYHLEAARLPTRVTILEGQVTRPRLAQMGRSSRGKRLRTRLYDSGESF